jgi:NAD(P)-dependent dehydrogenase (short-subunit alcohol dehydrogenase family)
VTASDAVAAARRGVRRRVRRGACWALGARRGPRQRDALHRAVAGRVVLVTGASDGIGEAVARDCAAAGATVVLVARRRGRLERVRDQVVAAGGVAHVHPADLSDLDDVDRLAAEVLDAHGAVDVLVNNAGRSIRRAVTDTVVHMPLVRTAMIAPTRRYDRAPAMSPREAAALVARAIADRPAQVSLGLRPVARLLDALAPRAVPGAWVRALRR